MNILNSCTSYSVDLLVAGEDIRKNIEESWGSLDADCQEVVMNLNDIEKYDIPAEAIDFDSVEFDEDELKDILEDLIGKHPHYLVFGRGMRWNGVSGYRFCDDIVSTCHRDYDISLVLKEKGKNAIMCLESSHDVPLGHYTYIIGLSEEDYAKLDCVDFDEISQFVNTRF